MLCNQQLIDADPKPRTIFLPGKWLTSLSSAGTLYLSLAGALITCGFGAVKAVVYNKAAAIPPKIGPTQ